MEAEGEKVDGEQFADFAWVAFSLKLPGFSLSVLPYLGGTDYLR